MHYLRAFIKTLVQIKFRAKWLENFTFNNVLLHFFCKTKNARNEKQRLLSAEGLISCFYLFLSICRCSWVAFEILIIVDSTLVLTTEIYVLTPLFQLLNYLG